MGNRTSSLESSCNYCAGPSSTAKYSRRHKCYTCVRCGSPFSPKDDPSYIPPNLPLKSMRVVPFAETLNQSQHTSKTTLLNEYVKPYFRQLEHEFVEVGHRFQFNQIDFKVLSCMPSCGTYTSETRIIIDNPSEMVSPLRTITVVPTKVTLDRAGVNDYMTDVIDPFFASELRVVMKDDTFVYNDVQFKVVHCNPESGIVDENTTLYTENEPLMDLSRIHMLPIYETLPNSEKEIAEELVFSKYLKPFFEGAFRVLHMGEEVVIDGVTFKVIAAEPSAGIVTLATVIYANGAPLFADDVRDEQLRRDEELARQLQMQMAREELQGLPMGFQQDPFGFAVIQPIRGAPQQPRIIELSAASRILQDRLADLIRQLPPNHPHRAALLNMQRDLANDQSGQRFAELLQIARQNVQIDADGDVVDPTRGAQQHQIDNLPVSSFRPADDSEHNSCRICLEAYNPDDELRTLPCFHRFHQACIDQWLLRDKKCPICKTSIG